MLSFDKVAAVFSTATDEAIEDFIHIFNLYSEDFMILSEFHINAFLAQIREEVGPTLESRRENLNYSCGALTKMFSYYRRHPSEASQDGRCNNHRANQRKIANKVYANRIGNGGYDTGDGYRYRGGGFIQLTGKDNYKTIAETLACKLNRKIKIYDVETEITSVQMGLLTSMAFWYNNDLNELDHIDKITKRINRYTDSYDKRKQHYLYLASL